MFNDIEKNCSLKKLVLNLKDQFKISSIGKIKPINIGIKHAIKHTDDLSELNLLTDVGLKFDSVTRCMWTLTIAGTLLLDGSGDTGDSGPQEFVAPRNMV